MNDGSIFLGKAYLHPVSGQACVTTFQPNEDHNCDEMGCASIGGHIVAWLSTTKTNVRSLPMLGDAASKEKAGAVADEIYDIVQNWVGKRLSTELRDGIFYVLNCNYARADKTEAVSA